MTKHEIREKLTDAMREIAEDMKNGGDQQIANILFEAFKEIKKTADSTPPDTPQHVLEQRVKRAMYGEYSMFMGRFKDKFVREALLGKIASVFELMWGYKLTYSDALRALARKR